MSTLPLLAYEVVPAKAAVASWLQQVLDPVIAACRFRSPPPIELRSTGDWRGWCASTGMATDGRVSLSGRARFWPRRELIEVYLHEASHRVLPGCDHDPVFCCLAHALLLRADAAGLTNDAASIYTNLYNIADLPAALANESDQGLGRALAWSVLTARELAATELDAEDLAAEVARRFDLWITEVAGEPVRRAQRLRQMARQQEVVEQLQEKVWTLTWVVSVLLSVLIAPVLWIGLK